MRSYSVFPDDWRTETRTFSQNTKTFPFIYNNKWKGGGVPLECLNFLLATGCDSTLTEGGLSTTPSHLPLLPCACWGVRGPGPPAWNYLLSGPLNPGASSSFPGKMFLSLSLLGGWRRAADWWWWWWYWCEAECSSSVLSIWFFVCLYFIVSFCFSLFDSLFLSLSFFVYVCLVIYLSGFSFFDCVSQIRKMSVGLSNNHPVPFSQTYTKTWHIYIYTYTDTHTHTQAHIC